MRTRFLAPLITAMVLGLGVLGYLGVHAALRAHHRSEFAAAEKQLKAMPLPTGVTVAGRTATGSVRFSCPPDPDRRCLHAGANARAVGTMFDRLLRASSDDCGTLPHGVGSCRIVGQIAGRAAYLIVFPHAYVTHGHIPAGAVGAFHDHLYYVGSDMILGLGNP
jgi:hypothetical protein